MNSEPINHDMNLSPESTPDRNFPPLKSTIEIKDWLVQHISEALFLDPKDVDVSVDFNSYGLSSRDAIVLSGDLEEWLGRRFSPTLLYEYPSIDLLSKFLAKDTSDNKAARELPGGNEVNKPTDQTAFSDVLPNLINEPIAVIGLECRFPGADNQEAYWALLENGIDAITIVPEDRWNSNNYYEPSPATKGKMVSNSGGFLDKIDLFDAQFFGISPREALRMDPQQRLLLQTAWRAFEDAGILPATLAGTACGVFIGISTNDYASFAKGDESLLDGYTGTGNAMCIAANRISYYFDLRGPSIAIDTACSSSLVAVHMAAESLRKGESNLAIAGGVNLILSPELNIIFSQAGMLSPDGRCKTFDASANGYVRGEGCAVVVLKRLGDALADGDSIHAIIRGSAVNQDGKSNGLTAPNGLAQQDVIRQAIKSAGITPGEIGYIEAHGTGTSLGDPIEMNAIAAVMQGRSKETPCIVGSVKTNVGHLESAAGIAGLVKVIMSLENEMIPAHLHFTKTNPFISLDEMPVKIPVNPIPWPMSGQPRYAGVSSFGFGGTNAHLIVSDHPNADVNLPEGIGHKILCISSKDPKTLTENVRNMQTYLKSNEDLNIHELCAIQSLTRTHFDSRIAWFIPDREAAIEKLKGYLDKTSEITPEVLLKPSSTIKKIAFLFTGQGSQYRKMGFTLYQSNPFFKKVMDDCQEIADQHLKKPLLSVIFEDDNLVNETEFTQPALFALEYSLARLIMSWGITPDAVMGHSLGEYVAATIAGVMSFEDGLRLVIERAKLMQALPPIGEMVAVFASREIVQDVLSPYRDVVTVAAYNGPNHTVISGVKEKVREVASIFEAKGLAIRFLNVSHAFHSPLMEPMVAPFKSYVEEIPFKPSHIPIVSNLTGQVLEAGFIVDSSYWCEHIRKPVRFQEDILELISLGCEFFIEIGPHPTLNGMGKRCLSARPEITPETIEWVATLQKNQVDSDALSETMALLYTNGMNLDWSKIGIYFETLEAITRLAQVRIPG